MGLRKTLLSISFLATALHTQAQSVDTLTLDVNDALRTNLWSKASNPIFIAHSAVQKIATAELFALKGKGDFVNYYQSDNATTWGAGTEAIQKSGSKTTFWGRLNYQNFSGKNMGGSAFINPYEMPFDITEYTTQNRGPKKSESYDITGSVAYQISPKILLAGRVDYKAANYAKQKDLRHANTFLQLQPQIGLMYNLSPRMEWGLSYKYNRRIESTKFDIKGNTDQNYLSLINYGAFFGRIEMYTESGYTSDSYTPLVEHVHTPSLQINTKIWPTIEWLNELSYGTAKGYFGKRGTGSITYTEHDYHTIQWTSAVQFHQQHQLLLNAQWKTLHNAENVFRKETNTGGFTSIVYYGQNQILSQENSSVALEYKGWKGISLQPDWEWELGIRRTTRNQNVTLYPFYRNANLDRWDYNAAVIHSIPSQWKFQLNVGFAHGSGNAYTDGKYSNSSQNTTASQLEYLQQEFNYLTSSQLNIHPAITRFFHLSRTTLGFVKAQIQHMNSFESKAFTQFGLSVGCHF